MMALNELVKKDEEEIPRMEEIVDGMQGNKWFSVIDLKERYFQIRIKEEDKHKMGFKINGKKYEWNRIPMGFKNSVAIFQRIMNYELREFIGKGCYVYMDDIIVYGRTKEEHNERLREILECLRKKRLKINVEKMQLCRNEMKGLGMIIDGKQ